MGFLDTIGHRAPESRPQSSRPTVAQNLTRDDAARPVRTAPARDSSQTNRIHPIAIWSAALIVVAAIAAGAWLGVRHSAIFSPDTPDTETAASASPQAATPVQPPTQKPRLVRPQSAVRPVTRGETAIDAGEARAETASEASVSVVAPVSEAANVTETTATPFEAVFDPIVAASIAELLEDDSVYSTEGAGVVAPRLTSLGFVHRLVGGLRVRTSTIELVVSKNGTVERAKIFSTPAHWEDALLLSRAKTFQFVPAYRNGFPVRYRFVMDVDTSP
jgi:hypothetical protein